MSSLDTDQENQQYIYAGLWPRMLAFGLDYLIIALYLSLIIGAGVVTRGYFPGLQQALFSNPVRAEFTGFCLVTLPVSLYFALLESSPKWQATWGKRRTGLIVTGWGGRRISRGRGLLRNGLKFIPWELAHFTIWQYAFASDQSSPFLAGCLALVWLLVGANLVSLFISPTRQAVYDRLSATWVRRGRIEA